MNTHSLHLTGAQQKKLLKGVPFQLKHSDLNCNGCGINIDFPKRMTTKINKAIRMGSGMRIHLSQEDIAHNVVVNPHLKQHLQKSVLNKLEGGGYNLIKATRRSNNRAKASFQHAGDEIVKNAGPILKAVTHIGIPIVTSIIGKKLGVDLSSVNKTLLPIADRGIDKRFKNNNTKVPNASVQNSQVQLAPESQMDQEQVPVSPYLGDDPFSVAGAGFRPTWE